MWYVGGSVGIVTHWAGPPGPPSPGERVETPVKSSPADPWGCACWGGVWAGVVLGCEWSVPPLGWGSSAGALGMASSPWDLLSPSDLRFFP